MSSAAEHTTFYCVHPAPPPTVNNLTACQKAQLRRSNTKLTKMLGAAPQIVDELPPKLLRTLPLSISKKLQPSISVTAGKASHKRTRSAGERVDPELYPLSSTLRPASHEGRSRRSSERKSRREIRRVHSRSLPSVFLNEELSSSPVRPRPQKDSEEEARTESFSRDSLCDSLYEPSFAIPSATKRRREKMARVCKLLGEDVPVDLVFPSNDDPEDEYIVLNICAPQNIETPPPTPPKPEWKPALPPKPEQPRWLTYRTSILETIVEQSPRASYSSASSVDSAFSLLTMTTSSSYRFTSSGCASDSSPTSSSAHDTAASAPLAPQRIHEISGTHGRREFAIYVPFRRRTSKIGQAEFGKGATQEFEVVRGMLDLRI